MKNSFYSLLFSTRELTVFKWPSGFPAKKIYQAAGEYASTFAITSLQVSGSFGTKTDKVEVPWNNKVNLNNSDTDVVIVVNGQ